MTDLAVMTGLFPWNTLCKLLIIIVNRCKPCIHLCSHSAGLHTSSIFQLVNLKLSIALRFCPLHVDISTKFWWFTESSHLPVDLSVRLSAPSVQTYRMVFSSLFTLFSYAPPVYLFQSLPFLIHISPIWRICFGFPCVLIRISHRIVLFHPFLYLIIRVIYNDI